MHRVAAVPTERPNDPRIFLWHWLAIMNPACDQTVGEQHREERPLLCNKKSSRSLARGCQDPPSIRRHQEASICGVVGEMLSLCSRGSVGNKIVKIFDQQCSGRGAVRVADGNFTKTSHKNYKENLGPQTAPLAPPSAPVQEAAAREGRGHGRRRVAHPGELWNLTSP